MKTRVMSRFKMNSRLNLSLPISQNRRNSSSSELTRNEKRKKSTKWMNWMLSSQNASTTSASPRNRSKFRTFVVASEWLFPEFVSDSVSSLKLDLFCLSSCLWFVIQFVDWRIWQSSNSLQNPSKVTFVSFSIQSRLSLIQTFSFSLPTRSDEEESRCGPSVTKRANNIRSTPTNQYYKALQHPRTAHVASTSSESRRKSTPTRIVPVPTYNKRQDAESSNVRVRGVIRDPSSSNCLYLLVESSPSGLSS